MKLVDVETFPLSLPEPHDSGTVRHVVLVRLRADDGIDGWGECVTKHAEAAAATCLLIDALAGELEGKDPLDITTLWERMRERTSWYGGGLAAIAISGLDMALWDLKGRILDLPVYELLGGPQTTPVRVCASVLFDMSDVLATAEEFANLRAAGFVAVKGGWGKLPGPVFGEDEQRDLEVVRLVREAIGGEVDLAVDVGTSVRWTVEHAVTMAHALEDCELLWLEEPLPPHDIPGYRSLRSATRIPLAAGEGESTVEGLLGAIESGAFDVLMPDPGKAEGITGVWQVVEQSAIAGIRFSPHTWSTSLSNAAAAHLLAASSNGVVLEVKPHESPMTGEIFSTQVTHAQGYAVFPDRPGLGVDVVEAALGRYALAGSA